jgi:hypothetical protein
LDDFMAASRLITGETQLDARLGREYAAAFAKMDHGAVQLTALLAACADALRSSDPPASLVATMSSDPTVAAAVQQLAHLWFAGAPLPINDKPQSFVSPEAYFGGLLWRAVGAHPPGLSGGYFGHWRYPPDA